MTSDFVCCGAGKSVATPGSTARTELRVPLIQVNIARVAIEEIWTLAMDEVVSLLLPS